jgi:hypothetical protein
MTSFLLFPGAGPEKSFFRRRLAALAGLKPGTYNCEACPKNISIAPYGAAPG